MYSNAACSRPRWLWNLRGGKVPGLAERRFGWGRDTVEKGLHESIRDCAA